MRHIQGQDLSFSGQRVHLISVDNVVNLVLCFFDSDFKCFANQDYQSLHICSVLDIIWNFVAVAHFLDYLEHLVLKAYLHQGILVVR